MQLILLSGGSGKRLWPLSNYTRSKQFLPLLETEDGTMESMLQRVVRQCREAKLNCDITIATNASQVGIISNQLGDTISIVTEPERRDTFPAIALATSYLKLVKNCSDEEVVVVMPCDPYTDAEYFSVIGSMADNTNHRIADLILMGIQPTYPSEKYGYIIPESTNQMGANRSDVQMVSHFIEKPKEALALKLIESGAYWNGGVFAFKLGYMMDIVKSYVNSDSFKDIRSRYYEFPKISFDYEVVEKAKSVAVVPFHGKWKDLGTWNSLTEELHRSVIGNAVLGTHCMNTHVINELRTPMYVDGLKDVVIAASSDGILVCGKTHSEYIKEAVENFNSQPMYEEHIWGSSRVLDDSKNADGHHSITKSITIFPGKSICREISPQDSGVWTFVEGEGAISIDGKEKHIKAGDTVLISKEHSYEVKAISSLTFIEVRCGNSLRK